MLARAMEEVIRISNESDGAREYGATFLAQRLDRQRRDRHGLDFLFRLFLALFAAFISAPLVAWAAADDWSVHRVVPLLLLVFTVILVLLRVHFLVPIVTSLSALCFSVLTAPGDEVIAFRQILGLVVFILVVELRGVVAIRWLACVAVGYVGLVRWLGPEGYGWAAVDDVVVTAGIWSAGALFVDELLRSRERVAAAQDELTQTELTSRFARTGDQVIATLRRILHDEVIGTLAAVADHRATRSPGRQSCPSCQTLQEDCGRVAHLLADGGASVVSQAGSLHELIEHCRRLSPVSIEVVGQQGVPLDHAQADAVGRAVAEALRNVGRHAGASAAQVDWRLEKGEVCLRVTDDGGGAREPQRTMQRETGGFGLRASVQVPLAEIGGTAALTRIEGRGAVLEMRWPLRTPSQQSRHTPLEEAHDATRRALAGSHRTVMLVVLVVLACNGWVAVRYSLADARWWEQLVLALVVAAATVAVAVRYRRAPLGRLTLLFLSVALAGVVHVQLLLAGGSDTLRGYNSYAVGLAAMLVTVCAFYTPLGWSLLVATPLVTVVVGHLIVGDLDIGVGGGAIIAALSPPLIGHAIGAYLRWSRQQEDEVEFRLKEAAAAVHRGELERALASRQLARVRQVVGPWLREVSTGEHDLHDPRVSTRARALAQSVRDDLHVPGVLDPVLSERIDRARQSGMDVVFEATDGDIHQAAPCLRLVDRLLDEETGATRIQVRLPERGRPAGSITVLPPPTPSALAGALASLEGWPHQVTHDEFAAVVTIQNLHELHDVEAGGV